MKFGFVIMVDEARHVADMAYDAEQAGWDGIFVPELIWGVDAWVSLAAAAMRTNSIRLGTLLTPVSRRRPWTLAGEIATLDRLSNGRVILSVGLGATDTGFDKFGEETDRRKRAELMDEGLDILTGLWQGQPFNYSGKHYRLEETTFYPPLPPIQQPRVPIWVVGAWPYKKSMRRVVRYDGLLPNVFKPDGQGAGQGTPEDLRQMRSFVEGSFIEEAFTEENRPLTTPFDFIIEGQTPGDDAAKAAEIIQPWAEAGATWWIEAMWAAEGIDPIWARLKQGPPGVG